jgi:iron complex outermembrane recepter protein
VRARTDLLAGVLAGALVLAAAAPVVAAPRPYDVPPGAMAQALRRYAEQTRIDVLFAPEAVATLRSPGGHGSSEPEAALERLLRGSGLEARRIGPGVYAVARRARGPAVKPLPAPATIDDPRALDEIVVQARRRDERLIDVPASVAAASARDLERLGGDGVLALRALAVGLTAAGQMSAETPTLVIRGQRRATAGESALSVITYLNEAPLPNSGSVLPSFDLSEVQVLRGPQGVLFGRNTTGGALLIRAAEPGQGGYARLSTGSHRLREIELAQDLGEADAPLQARIALYGLKRDGLVENLGVGDDLDDRNQAAVRLSLAYSPAGPFSALLILDAFRARETGSATILSGVYPNPPAVTGGGNARTVEATPYYDCGVAGCDIDIALAQQRALGPRRTRVGLAPRSDRDNDGATLRLDWRGAALSVRSVTSYRRAVLNSALDADGSMLALNDIERRIGLGQFTQEIRANGAHGDTTWQAGLFYMSTVPVGVQKVRVGAAVTPTRPVRLEFSYRRGESRAAFVDITRRLGRGFELETGLRYTHDTSSACLARHVVPAADVSEAACGAAREASSSAPTWTVGLSYRGRPNLTAYVVSRRAYRAGGVNAPILTAALGRYQDYAPEKLTDVEAGLKWAAALGDWRYGADAAVFRGWSRDIQRALFPADDFDGDGIVANDPPNLIINAGAAVISGLELGLRGQRGERLAITVSATATRARFTALTVPTALASLTVTDPRALRFSYTPPYTIRVGAEWRVLDSPRLGRWTAWGEVFRSGKVRYVERGHDDNGLQKGYALADLGLVYQPPRQDALSISGSITNLFDKTYAAGGGAITPSITATSVIHGEPRLMRFTLQRRF